MGFAERMREYRKRLSLTQNELADKMDTTQKTISAWEVERSEPTMGDVVKLCDIFDCTIEDLTGTRTRRTGEITLDDVYVFLSKLKIEQLRTLRHEVDYRIEYLEEKDKIEHERRELQKKLSEVQKRINILEKRSQSHNEIA